MDSTGAGRAISGSGTPSTPKDFSPKDEPIRGRIAQDLKNLKIPGLRVVSSQGERMLYSRDQSEIPRFMKTILFRSVPDVVVQAETPEAVTAVLKYASKREIPVIPRGSGSSPFGGSVPVLGGIVLDVSSMDKILDIDVAGRTATVQAGVRWADLDHELEKHGLCISTSPSSKFSTIAGWIATGGIGLNSFSRGHLRTNVLALELAAPDGTVKRYTQSDRSFVTVFGSEGQLGVITSVMLEVREKPKHSRPHLVLFDDMKSALSFAHAIAWSPVKPVHIVYESATRMSLSNGMMGGDHLRVAEAIIVYVEGESSEKAFDSYMKKLGIQEEKEYLARYLWNERFFPMKIRKLGPGMLGTEVLVLQSILPSAVSKTTDLCSGMGIDPLFEVHFLPDGRALLLCFFMTDQGNTLGYTLDALKSLILTRALIEAGAKPYSVGIWNTSFTDAEDQGKVKRLRELKARLDPRGIMNPGKYFFLSGRFGKLGGLVMSPQLMRPALRAVIAMRPLSTKVLKFGSDFARRSYKPENRTELLRIADECAMCGACVSVCPAYLAVRDERVTARGKLLTVKAMAGGLQPTKEHAHRIFLCMRCKACEQVCQSKLQLIQAFEQLENELEATYGKDLAEIEAFVKHAETMPEYDELVERGLVLGAPKHGTGGGIDGV